MTHTQEPFEVAGTAIYRGKVKIAQCLDVDAEEMWGEAILPRKEWRELLPSHEQAIANADTLVYRANHYHELRAERDALRAALVGMVDAREKTERDRLLISDPYGTCYTATQITSMWGTAMVAARAALKGAK